MKLYIPFNSNDYNNVFSTLSISPREFYSERRFGFKRATRCKLNPYEQLLVAYKRPTFIRDDYDYDSGFPINLVIDYKYGSDDIEQANEAQVFFIYDTIYLFDDFELLFRSESEKTGVESKSYKSVETKFTHLARSNSKVLSKGDIVHWIDNEIAKEWFDGIRNHNLPENNLSKERQLNKILGTVVGFAVGSQRNLPGKYRKLDQVAKELNNACSLYINRIGELNQKESKKSVENYLDRISDLINKIAPLEEAILKHSNDVVDRGFIEQLKRAKILDQPLFKLIKTGLLKANSKKQPISLKVEKVNEVLGYRVNKKYPQSYIERLNKHIKELLYDIDDVISNHVAEVGIDPQILGIEIIDNEDIHFEFVHNLSEKEGAYLHHVVQFFINEDTFISIDEIQASRRGYLADLGKYLKKKIDSFGQSEEAEYLRKLHSSFNNLTEPFDINSIQVDTLKCIALLFTKGRDFMQYRELVQKASITHNEIGYAIWGAAFGFAGLPKTLTQSVFDDIDKCEVILSNLSTFISEFTGPNHEHILAGIIALTQKVNEKERPFREKNSIGNDRSSQVDDRFNNPFDDHKLLEKLLAKVDEIPRAKNNSEFKNYLSNIYRDIAEESKLEDLFNSPDAKRKKFVEKITKSKKMISGIGDGTVKKVVSACEDLFNNELQK